MSRRRQQTARGKTGACAGTPRGMRWWHASKERCGTREALIGGPRWAKTERIRPMAESVRSRKGIRGVHSTNEGVQENTLEGRGPALVELELRVSARAWA